MDHLNWINGHSDVVMVTNIGSLREAAEMFRVTAFVGGVALLGMFCWLVGLTVCFAKMCSTMNGMNDGAESDDGRND